MARPNWRKSGSPENIERMLTFNNWLSENASQTEPPMALLDTTEKTIEETVKSIQEWLTRTYALAQWSAG